ncbi:MAG TPA: DUF4390 domain-containing protein [Smithellaceae bacterium]|nr:DUF4390 domain-containing protein [Smithellaceae bacterium]HRS88686.1 DUF4390 domain-containing protein [Smithellaceae bacterium]HRV26748.1 DUF4390 domain-containing protein [Smithellaceae bacterium]
MAQLRILFVALCILVFFTSCAGNKNITAPQIADFIITNNEANVLLYARLVNGFKDDIVSEIMAGVPKEYILQIRVYEERPYIWSKKIKSSKIRRTIKYDNLKKTFIVSGADKPEPAEFSDLYSAQNAMADFNGIIVIPIIDLQRNKNYYLKTMVTIDKVRLPLRLERLFFFVSFWDYATAWYKQKFILK